MQQKEKDRERDRELKSHKAVENMRRWHHDHLSAANLQSQRRPCEARVCIVKEVAPTAYTKTTQEHLQPQ